jgi:hypothetical protein
MSPRMECILHELLISAASLLRLVAEAQRGVDPVRVDRLSPRCAVSRFLAAPRTTLSYALGHIAPWRPPDERLFLSNRLMRMLGDLE